MENKHYHPGQIVKFIKKATVYNTKTNNSFEVTEGIKARVVEDRDSGVVGALLLEMEKEGGEKIIVKTNDTNVSEV